MTSTFFSELLIKVFDCATTKTSLSQTIVNYIHSGLIIRQLRFKFVKYNVVKISSFIAAFLEVGSYETLVDRFFNATAQNRSLVNPNDASEGYCGEPPRDSMHLFRSGESDLPWSGVGKKNLYRVIPTKWDILKLIDEKSFPL